MAKQVLRSVVLVLLSFGFILNPSFAKVFSTQYCEFQLPPGWKCALEGTEWVCQNSNEDRRREAIIILAAKIRGPSDSLSLYQAHLKAAKTFTLPGGQTQVSEPKYTKLNTINDHSWVDSLHMASEIPGFYTRYMATTKEDLGIAVTFSVAKDHYEAYQDLFERIIQTIRVFRQKNVKTGNFVPVREGNDGDLLDGPIIPTTDGVADLGRQRKRRGGSGGGGAADYLIYLAIAGAAGFALVKLRKKKPGVKKKRKKKKTDDS